MIRALVIALLAAIPAAIAQESGPPSPTIAVSVDPPGPVTVGAPVEVAVTVLVPTYMPQPPDWPDLQIADAITRLPERATVPVTRRVGHDTWSGLTRSYEITPQRAADFDLGGAEATVRYADPETNERREATLPLPDVVISAVLPKGAEALDPFVSAQNLTLRARVDGLPDAPKPGDAFRLTLTTVATGTRSMLLPPLADRLDVPAGLRAYPRQPELSDTATGGGDLPTATRIEAISFVIEAPGAYILPAQSVEWWNTAAQRVETATTDPIDIAVAGALGDAASQAMRTLHPLVLAGAALVLAALGGGLAVLRHRHRGRLPSPSERRLYRQLRAAVRRGRIGTIRPRLYRWSAALTPSDPGPQIETLLRRLERAAFGPEPAEADATIRAALLAALVERRRAAPAKPLRVEAALPALNPDWSRL